ncbi:cell division protein ZapD [Gammaproteobacteria bacterium]|nr:cell division protein ZapD [Gammaproteobacteria bacterium]
MIYEKAFSEILRLSLGFEVLVLEVEGVIRSREGLKYALDPLIEAIGYLERRDFKTKLLSELYVVERILSTCKEIAKDNARQSLIQVVVSARVQLAKSAVVGKQLLADPLLGKMYYKHQGVDAVLYQQCWHNQQNEEKIEQLKYWLGFMQGYQEAVQIILHIYRGLSRLTDFQASRGFYRQSFLNQDLKQVHLVRVKQDQPQYYPVIAMTKRWLTVTWYEGAWQEGQFGFSPTKQDIGAQIAICSAEIFAQVIG